MTKAQKAEQLEAISKLREILPPGSTVYTVLRHVSQSGMQRRIDCFAIDPTDARYPLRFLSGYVAKALEYRTHDRGGLVVNGCGMDMGFHLVHSLGYALGSVKEPWNLRHEWI